MISHIDLSGLVLAGGKSSRFGQDKSNVLIGGKTMLEKSLELLNNISDHIFISSNLPDHEKYGYPVIYDEFRNIGPIGGLYSGFRHIKTRYVFVISVDLPLLSVETILKIIKANENNDVVIPRINTKLEPLCGLYKTDIKTSCETQILNKDYKIISLYDKLDVKYVDFSFRDDEMNPFTNINTFEDYLKYASGI